MTNNITDPNQAIALVLSGTTAVEVLPRCVIEFPYTRGDWHQASQTLGIIVTTKGVVAPHLNQLSELIIGIANLCDADRKSVMQKLETA